MIVHKIVHKIDYLKFIHTQYIHQRKVVNKLSKITMHAFNTKYLRIYAVTHLFMISVFSCLLTDRTNLESKITTSETLTNTEEDFIYLFFVYISLTVINIVFGQIVKISV